jgi:hypothetical protein
MQVQCPSGLQFVARPWRIGDQAELLNTKEQLGGMLPKKMLSLAALDVIDPGPYKFTNRIDVDELSIPDITVGNILIRIGTRKELWLRPTCASCRKILRDPIEVDLTELGPFYMASPEGVDHLKTGVPIQRDYGDGVHARLRAIRGCNLLDISKLQEEDPEHIVEHQLVAYIDEISGPGTVEAVAMTEKGAPLRNKPHILRYIRTLPWEIREKIEMDVDELFGGVDTTITFRCDHPECTAMNEVQVPLDLNFYGLDNSARRSKLRKNSLATRSAVELMRSSSSPSSSEAQKPPA